MIRITALMDNDGSERRTLINEHGLSYLVEGEGHRILFDCGGTANAITNARNLGRSLKDLDAVVLSHAHYDHAAGYRYLLEAGLGSKVLYTGPDFWEPKYGAHGMRFTDLSAGFDEGFLTEHGITQRVTQGLNPLGGGVYLVSGFPRIHSFETIPARFVRRTEAGFVPDDFHDEQCLVLDRDNQLYVFVGCSHPGILNILTHVHNLLQKPIAAVFGGTHLMEADEERIAKTLAVMQELGLETVGLGHCSGSLAEEAAEKAGISTCHLSCGSVLFLQ